MEYIGYEIEDVFNQVKKETSNICENVLGKGKSFIEEAKKKIKKSKIID